MPKIIKQHGCYILRTRSRSEMNRPKFFIEWSEDGDTRWIVGSNNLTTVQEEFDHMTSGYVVESWPKIKSNEPFIRDGNFEFLQESTFRLSDRSVYCINRSIVLWHADAYQLAYILNRDPNIGWVAIFNQKGQIIAQNFNDPDLKNQIYGSGTSYSI